MATKHLTLRVDQDSFRQLDDESRRQRLTRSELAKRFIDEGLRMAVHPGIVFRTGPTGRRAALANGPDVWEIVQDFSDWDDQKHPANESVGSSSLYPHQIRQALRYHAEFPDEIAERIKQNEDAAARSYSERGLRAGKPQTGEAPAG
jgi:hypothetical protein